MTSRTFRRSLLFAAALATGATPARAGWQPDGIPVCLHPLPQDQPEIVSDGSGGAYVTWEDSRNYAAARTDIYLQRLTASGDLAPGWPAGGLPLCTAPEPQFRTDGSFVADGEGGVLATWWDRRNGNQDDIYVQRIGPSGSPAPGWPVDGARVTDLPLNEERPVVASDWAGGAFVVWRDGRNGNADLYAMHLLADGSRAPGWPENGLPVSTGPLDEGDPQLLADGTGGVIIAWGYGNFSAVDIRAIRLTGTGELAPGWVAGGNVMCAAPRIRAYLHLVSDGPGGAYLAWVDYRTSPPGTPPDELSSYADIYVQRFTGSGDIAPGWPSDGLPLCTLPTIQQDVSLAADGSGGCFVAWVDYRAYDPNYSDVFVVRVQGDGTLASGWTPQGTLASTAVGFQLTPKVVGDGSGGVYLLYNDYAGEGYKLAAQHLAGNGQLAPGWPAEGLRVVQMAGQQNDQQAIPDGLGGAIVTWTDFRGAADGSTDIFAQQVNADGPTSVLVSLVSAEAEAGLVRLKWYAGGEASFVASVERRTETGEWERLDSISADGSGTLTYEDRAVAAGTRYAYRLAYPDEGGITYTPETWVTVPAPKFALRGLTPNPSVGDPVVAFSLASDEPASIDVYDLAGRQVYTREVGSLGPGTQSLRLGMRARLAAGVYTVVLRQGTQVARARAVVIR